MLWPNVTLTSKAYPYVSIFTIIVVVCGSMPDCCICIRDKMTGCELNPIDLDFLTQLPLKWLGIGLQ